MSEPERPQGGRNAEEVPVKRRNYQRRWFLIGLITAAVALAAGALWFARGSFGAGGATAASPVQVILVSPASGDDALLGDYVPVAAWANGPAGISSVEFLVDGQSAGVVREFPENASWTWQAVQPGVHTLTARATAPDGRTGESQAVQFSVLKTRDMIPLMAKDGQLLIDIGHEFGLQPFSIAEANPQLDPLVPRHGGQWVNVPVAGFLAARATQPAPGERFPLTISWDLKLTRQANKAYCYLSTGDGVWDRIPRAPYRFFESTENQFAQFLEATPPRLVLQAECWGWKGNTLQYMGQGETAFDTAQQSAQIEIFGQGFQLTGRTEFGQSGNQAESAAAKVPAPYVLREPTSASECAAHGGESTACAAVLNAPVKTAIVLEWEWLPGLRWGGKTWINTINGYHIYEIDRATGASRYLEELSAQQRATPLPLLWGELCYGVRAYAVAAEYGGLVESDVAIYCPKDGPKTEQTTLAPSAWMTSGGKWVQEYDCAGINDGSAYASRNRSTGFGSAPGEVLVGSFVLNRAGDCYREGDYAAGIAFPKSLLPASAILKKAVLTFESRSTEYDASGQDLGPAPDACIAEVGIARQAWESLGGRDHSSDTWLTDPTYYRPFASISGWMSPSIDITPVVEDWIADPDKNHGIVLAPPVTPSPSGSGEGRCLSWLGNFQLAIDYIVP